MMPTPEGLELLSWHLDNLLGREYQSLSIFYHALRNKDGHPALEKDEHRAHLAVLSSLIHADAPVPMLEIIHGVLKNCLPVYHVRYETNREESIVLAAEKIAAAITQVRASDWSKRDLALEPLRHIEGLYLKALSRVPLDIITRVPVTILEEGYYSLDVETARRVLCIDAVGKELRVNTSGAHAVCAANGIHYKPDPQAVIGAEHLGISAIQPAQEYAASSLMQYVAGNQLAAAPTGLLSIQQVPLARADAPKTTGGIVQAGLSIEGMCFREFLFLRQAIRLLKSAMGDEALIQLLEDEQRGYRDYLAIAKAKFPHDFFLSPATNEEEHAARSMAFQQSFQSLAQGHSEDDCFEEMKNESFGRGVSEAGRVYIYRELYEKHKADTRLLQLVLVLASLYPSLMRGQSIRFSLRLIAALPALWTLFPNKNAKEAIEDIGRVLTHYLNKEAASALWVGLLLSLPSDAKSDNFRLQLFHDEDKNLKQCRIVGIDNDMSFGMPFVRLSEEEAPRLGLSIKNVLYFLPELLDQTIDAHICARLLRNSARSQWLSWLSLVARRNEEQMAWVQQGILSAEQAAHLQVRISKRVLEFILAQWERLAALLRENPHISHGALLNALYPTVAAAYHEVVIAEAHAQKRYANLIDYEMLVHAEYEAQGYYKIPFHPQRAAKGERIGCVRSTNRR